MIGNSVFAATIIFLALMLWLMQECRFLIPYRDALITKYGSVLTCFAIALFVNLFAAMYLICRKLFLKDTGRKLAHLERQLRTKETPSEDLSRRLDD